VFDGAPDPALPEGAAFRGVKILYAERGSDADTRIEQLVDSSPNPGGLTVITSDRQLAFLVRSRGASVVRSGSFRSEVDRLLESTPAHRMAKKSRLAMSMPGCDTSVRCRKTTMSMTGNPRLASQHLFGRKRHV
jgi:predicted RNA-binding protein with PIN domain